MAERYTERIEAYVLARHEAASTLKPLDFKSGQQLRFDGSRLQADGTTF